MAKKPSAPSAKNDSSGSKKQLKQGKAASASPKSDNKYLSKLKKIKPAQVKHGFKVVFKWVAISAIIFFFVGGPIIAAWMGDKETKDRKKQQEKIQKQIDEYTKKAEEEAANKPKQYDPSLKFDGDLTSLEIIDEKTGDGTEIKEGDEFKAKYKVVIASSGEISEEGELDVNLNTGQPYKLEKGGLIDGWVEGMIGMKVGGVRVIKVPSEKAYGEEGNSSIPGNTDLAFRIELIEVNPGQ